MKLSLAVLTLVLVSFSTLQATATMSFEGQVVNVVPDEEGMNVMMKGNGGEFKSMYIPRSNSNTGVTQKAIDALRTKRNIKLSL